ncbi:MAG: Modification methylase HindIII [Turneriella sp.]|nr:Modification methylase HindIII [Turneriella sp.]
MSLAMLGFNDEKIEHFEYRRVIGVLADSFAVMRQMPSESIHAVVTDPPYGVKEFYEDQLAKKDLGRGGIWRIPPSFDGNQRAPLPRFTALNAKERTELFEFFANLSSELNRVLKPGGHVILASNSFLSQMVFEAMVKGGLEFRGEVIRLVQTLRGGDRPKNAETEFPEVCSMPRGSYEPWGLFRKALPNRMTVAECLRQNKTGGLRRRRDGLPFSDVINSERTTKWERATADHPSLKPQSFMREIVYSALPLGEGVILDPFMGAGTTLAAAAHFNYACIGIEINPRFFKEAERAIPALNGDSYAPNRDYSSSAEVSSGLFAS